MSQTKQKLSKIRKDAKKLFALESALQRSVSVLNIVAIAGVCFLAFPSAKNNFQISRAQLIILLALGTFLIVNYIQHRLLVGIRRKWSQLEEQSTHDGLTSAFNRETFDEILDEEMSRAKRYRVALSLCIIDLDNFKTINDTYGHPQGDRLLKDFAERVHNVIRTTDCFARYGGDEFCILLSHTDLIQAEKFLNRLLLETQEWLDTSFSAGVTTYRPAEDKISFVTRADLALYQAKREGKNRIRCLIGEDDHQVVVEF